MAGREHMLGIVVGEKGSGKTYQTINTQIIDYLTGNHGRKKPRKVLIMDSNNEYGDLKNDHGNMKFPHVRAIRAEDVAAWVRTPVVEARRVSIMKPVTEGGGKMNLEEYRHALHTILDDFQGGLLILEDLTKYVTDSMPGDLLGTIVTQRHVAVDTIIHFQTIGKMAHPQLWGNANWCRIHMAERGVQKKKENLGGHMEPLLLVEELVHINTQGEKDLPKNKRFYAYYRKDIRKIQGNQFNYAIFKKGVESFLERNMKLVKEELNREDLYSGEKIHPDRKAAIDALIKKYTVAYYGNPDNPFKSEGKVKRPAKK